MNKNVNRIIANISPLDLKRWEAQLVLVTLETGTVLLDSKTNLDYVYFPIDCILSLSHVLEDEQCASFTLIGNQGMLDAFAFLGESAGTHTAKVECAGKAYRFPAQTATEEAALSGKFRILILNYMQTLVMRSFQSAICDTNHSTYQQVSHAILVCHDFLLATSSMLAIGLVARFTGASVDQVTRVATELHAKGLVKFELGKVSNINQMGLKKSSCECYQKVKSELDRLLPISN